MKKNHEYHAVTIKIIIYVEALDRTIKNILLTCNLLGVIHNTKIN